MALNITLLAANVVKPAMYVLCVALAPIPAIPVLENCLKYLHKLTLFLAPTGMRIKCSFMYIPLTFLFLKPFARYLIIIDDLQGAVMWKDIKKKFPENDKGNSIILTTNVKGVASFCSTGRFMYTIHSLSNTASKKLFWERVQLNRSDALGIALKNIFLTCQGSPLAIISVANLFLEQGKVNLTADDCEGLSLGKHLVSDDGTRSFNELRRVVAHCYNSLPTHVHRVCLLAVTMFPKGYRIKKNSLVREIVAGGLVHEGCLRVAKESMVLACLDELINLGIIEPAAIGVDFAVKRFQVDGITHRVPGAQVRS